MTVLKIIALLVFIVGFAWIFWPRSHITGPADPNSKTRNTAWQLGIAIHMFHDEYNYYPVPQQQGDVVTTSDATLMRVLQNQEESGAAKLNSHGITYLDTWTASPRRAGFDDDFNFIDRWKSPFHVILDMDNDGHVTDPESGKELPERILVYSAGPDGDPQTWEDNIKSRAIPARQPPP